MKSFSKFLIILIALGCFSISGRAQESQQPMTLQDAINGYESVTNGHAGVPEDWSTHRLIFSQPVPGTPTYDKVMHDPRYWMQQIRRSSGTKTVVDAGTDDANAVAEDKAEKKKKKKKNKVKDPKKPALKKDWSETFIANGQVQPNMYPAKFNFFPTATASCANDFVVYPTGVVSAAGAANIIAYNQLYGTASTGCGLTDGGTVPKVNWAYNTGTGNTITTSPIISNDTTGSQVAYIQSNGTTASLVVLRWAASASETLTAPGTLTAQGSNTFATRCTAPCFYSVSLGANDTYSSPYYDFSGDAVYVGDDSGKLHKISGVFNGTTIAEASGFPATLNAGVKIATPVFDSGSGNVFVGDLAAILHSVVGSTGAVHGTSSDLGDVIIDSPIVDSSASSVYAFVTTNSAGNNAVYQFTTSFTGGTGNGTATGTAIGTGGTGDYLFDGTFDNVYFLSANATGNLWVMGNSGAAGGNLYRIAIGANAMGATSTAAITGLTDTGNGHFPWSSPATEFCNAGASACAVTTGGTCGAGVTCTTTGTDYLLFSVDRTNSTIGGCTNTNGVGCVLSYKINTTTPAIQGSAAVTTVTTPGCWSTGGIIVDNADTTPTGTSNLYLLELNGNGAGGPTHNTFTSSACTGQTATASPIALQEGQGL